MPNVNAILEQNLKENEDDKMSVPNLDIDIDECPDLVKQRDKTKKSYISGLMQRLRRLNVSMKKTQDKMLEIVNERNDIERQLNYDLKVCGICRREKVLNRFYCLEENEMLSVCGMCAKEGFKDIN